MNGRVRSRVAKYTGIAFALAVAVSGCAKDAPQTTLKPKGPKAETINDLINPVFMVAGVVFVFILGGALFVALKFKARDDEDYDEFPEQVHGNFKMEIGWTIAPAVILAVIGAFTVATILDLAKKPEPDTMHVEVYGQQWWWEYRYDTNGDGKFDDIVTANDLVIPTGQDIALRIRSRDVIHSWWAPALNGKKDAVPGRTHPLTINAPSEGEYIGQCTEYCGLSHAEMRIKVVALSPEDFETWQDNQLKDFTNPTDAEAQAGWATFAGQCTSCHRINGLTDPASVGEDEDPADATKAVKYPAPNDTDQYPDDGVKNTKSGAQNQVSGAAPNLTHFMSRSMFAGGKFDLRKDTAACRKLGEDWASTSAGIRKCLNRKDLEAWLRNPPLEKAMKAGDAMTPNSRGMPNFNLTEDQIDQLVAFLSTLK
jgi:cytochrome c oxidase subunit 2